jgi:hypothetical protein
LSLAHRKLLQKYCQVKGRAIKRIHAPAQSI